jgi:predicted metal-binding transcription factor (methanogenesis marker protein 9)
MLKLSAVLINTYKSSDYKNKETGVTTEGRNKLQLLAETPMKNGSIKKELIDLSVKPEVYLKHKDSIGKTIEVNVGYFGNTTFFGI